MTPITLRPPRRRAFTLVEIMLVVAIAGVMSVMAVVTLQQTAESSRERGAARGVSALIKRARSLAMQQHKIVSIVVDGNGLKLMACPAQFGTNTCANAVAKTDVPNAFVRFGTQQESRGVTMTYTPAPCSSADQTACLTFNVLGMPVTPAAYTFNVNHPGTPGSANINVTAGGDVRVQ